MSRRALAVSACLAALLFAAVLCGCGSGDGAEPSSASATMTSELGSLAPAELATSVEEQTVDFLDRKGTALHRSLTQFLGGKIAAEVSQGTAECRSGDDTASIASPSRYPFACIVEGSADGNGLTVNITLGFVGLDLHGRCWRAANERVSATSSAPTLLTRQEAMRPINQIAGCA